MAALSVAAPEPHFHLINFCALALVFYMVMCVSVFSAAFSTESGFNCDGGSSALMKK